MRARISTLAAPNMIVDSDGAIMLSHWVEETYLTAVLYSTPSLYYIKQFHDGIAWSDEKMKALGNLLSLSGKKQWGVPRLVQPGQWVLYDEKEEVVGATFEARRIILFGEGNQGYLFSWDDKEQEFPLFGKKILSADPALTIEKDHLKGTIQSGKVYLFTYQ